MSIIKRFQIYFTERFPLVIYLPFVIILYFCLSIMIQLLNSSTYVFDKHTIAGVCSALFFMLMIRTFDDLKDVELDMEIFPERPVSRGDVKVGDVKLLAVLSGSALVIINAVFAPDVLLIFSIVMVYALLTFKWFFMHQLHIEKPIVAMITHQPLPASIIFYLIHTCLATGHEYESFQTEHLYVLFMFALPITAWEISRKTKAKKDENKYETFSKIFGTTFAGLAPLVLFGISVFFSILVSVELRFPLVFPIIVIVSYLFAAYFYIKYILAPTSENSNLKNVALVFVTVFYAIILTFLVIRILQ